MPDETRSFESAVDGMAIVYYTWRATDPKAVVVISHGAAEHALRYERFARALNAEGFDVWAADHRGHGATARPDALGDFGAGGWNGIVADLGQTIAMARREHPGLPVVLFAHSMGAAVGQQYVPDASETIDALVLSGSTAREPGPPPATSLNSKFEPGRTPYDWLSRDPVEVDKYADDPLCGFDLAPMRRPGQHADLAIFGDPQRLARIRADLPCLFMAGTADPVNRGMEGLRLLETWWRAAGVRRIDTLYYEGGRHEMLNETNRDEVTRDVIGWFRDVLSV